MPLRDYDFPWDDKDPPKWEDILNWQGNFGIYDSLMGGFTPNLNGMDFGLGIDNFDAYSEEAIAAQQEQLLQQGINNVLGNANLTPEQRTQAEAALRQQLASFQYNPAENPDDSGLISNIVAAASTTAPEGTTTPPATTPPVTPPPSDSNIIMDAVREVGKFFDAGLKAFGDLIGGFDLSAVILNPVNPKATVVFGPPSGSPVTVIGNMPTSKAPIGVNTGIPALDAVIASVFAGKNNNRPIREVIEEAIYDAVSKETGVDVEDIIKGTETGLEGVVDQVEKVVTGLNTKVTEVEAVQRPKVIADWYDKNRALPDSEIAKVMDENGVTTDEMAAAIGEDPAEVKRRYDESKILKETDPDQVEIVTDANPPRQTEVIIDPTQSEVAPPFIGPLGETPPSQVEVVTGANPPRQVIGTVGPSGSEEAPLEDPDPFPDPEPEPLPIPLPPPEPPAPDPEPEPVPIIPPPITPPDGPPPPRTPEPPPDYTPVIGGALGGLFGAITPTPITDSIFAPEKVKFNRLPLDITNTLFGGFRR
jgi:hypothetical protein